MLPGETTSQMMLSVVMDVAGSTKAVSGSGSSSMSDSLIFWKPRMDEPSKPMPSVNRSATKSSTGMEKCCQRPGRSMNLKSTIFTPRSLACARTALGSVLGSAIFGPVAMAIRATLSSRDHNNHSLSIRPFAAARGQRRRPRALLVCRSLSPARGLRGPHGRLSPPARAVRSGSIALRWLVAVVQSGQMPGGWVCCGTVPKYEPLAAFLSSLPKGQKQVSLGFKRLEDMLGELLPPSALEYEQ